MKSGIARSVCVVFVLSSVAVASRSTANGNDRWILIDGASAGTSLFTATGSRIVAPDLNDDSAEGHVADGEENCDLKHFHGTLDDEDDPAPKACGHGKVALDTNVTDEVLHISDAVTYELSALDHLDDDPAPDFTAASADCDASKNLLTQAELALEAEFKAGLVDLDKLQEINEKIEDAMRRDEKCSTAAQASDAQKGRRAVKKGLEFKHKALRKIFKAGLALF